MKKVINFLIIILSVCTIIFAGLISYGIYHIESVKESFITEVTKQESIFDYNSMLEKHNSALVNQMQRRYIYPYAIGFAICGIILVVLIVYKVKCKKGAIHI